MKIMVGGGIEADKEITELAANTQLFAKHLAKQVISQGHTLICGNLTAFDAIVIEAACDEVGDDEQAEQRVISYRPDGSDTFVNRGSVLNSSLKDWTRIGRKLRYPEPIHHADVVILVAGWDGTHTAANWAQIAGKPVLPVASFGQAAREIYERERQNLPAMFGRKADCAEFDVLNKAVTDGLTAEQAEAFADKVVSLAERMTLSREAFIIMSYNGIDELNHAKLAFEEVCTEAKFAALRLDDYEPGNTYEIKEQILDKIRSAAFVIVDLTESRPNVYFELGYAAALGKRIVLTAKEGTEVHFDVNGLKRIEWKDFVDLRNKLRPVIKEIEKAFGGD